MFVGQLSWILLQFFSTPDFHLAFSCALSTASLAKAGFHFHSSWHFVEESLVSFRAGDASRIRAVFSTLGEEQLLGVEISELLFDDLVESRPHEQRGGEGGSWIFMETRLRDHRLGSCYFSTLLIGWCRATPMTSQLGSCTWSVQVPKNKIV